MEQAAIEQGRPVEYLTSKIDKEKRAQEIAQRDDVKQGLVAVFTSVEPCMTYRLGGVRATKKLALKLVVGKCLHYEHDLPEWPRVVGSADGCRRTGLRTA